MNRREFVTTTAAMAGCALMDRLEAAEPAGDVPKGPLVGSQLYGWGQYLDRDHKALGEHLDEVFAALKDAGYDYAEGNLDTGSPENIRRFADALRKRGLKPVSLYTGGALHTDEAARTTAERITKAAAVAVSEGFRIVNYNVDPIGRLKTDTELEVQGKALAALGAALSKLGVRLGLHHHTPEFAGGAKEYHAMFRAVPADSLGYCYDVHWAYRGGVEPKEAMSLYGARIVSWHLRQSRDKIWWEDLDTGDVDYPWIADYAARRKIPALYTVELAIEGGTKLTRGAVENHAHSREYVRRVFGV
jgi:sugar phosphate isomerase/epimerase